MMSTRLECPTETRMCTHCGKVLPIDQFRFQKKSEGRRHPICRRCRAAEARRGIFKKRHRRIGKGLTQIINACREQRSVEMIAASVHALSDSLGGMAQLSQKLEEHRKHALKSRHGGSFVMKMHFALYALTAALRRHETSQAKEVSKEQLADRILELANSGDLDNALQQLARSGALDHAIRRLLECDDLKDTFQKRNANRQARLKQMEYHREIISRSGR